MDPSVSTLTFTALAVGLLLVLTRNTWLVWLGLYLVKTVTPEKADIVVVLSGGITGNRLQKAVELAEQGFAPRVLVTGPRGPYGTRESDLAIGFAKRHNLNTTILESLHADINSTLEEALIIDKELQRLAISTALIVTSEYHSRRTWSIFNKYGSKKIRYTVVASKDPLFDPKNWWKTRNGRKTFVVEYMKTLNSWFE